MKKIPVILAVVALAFAVSSMSNCTGPINSITASSTMAKEIRKVSDFDKVEVEGIFEVEVTYSSAEEVEIEAPENIMEYIDLKVKSGTLSIEIDKRTQIKSSCSIKVHIKTAKLNGFELSGASSVQLNNTLKDSELTIESSGAATFKGDVKVREAEIELNGASTTSLSGSAEDATIELSGASQLNSYKLEIDNLEVELSGASSAKVTSLKSMKGDISGASSLTYDGNPGVKQVSTSGASSLSRK